MRCVLSLIVLVMSLAAAAAGSVFTQLDGRWVGPGLELFIDISRHQGNTDPRKPFTREPLAVRNITGRMVVFSIGTQSFIALVDGNAMSITRPDSGDYRSVTLVRVPQRPHLATAATGEATSDPPPE